MIKIIVKIKERTGRRDDRAITLYGNDIRHKYGPYVSEETFPSFVLISLSNFKMTYLFIFFILLKTGKSRCLFFVKNPLRKGKKNRRKLSILQMTSFANENETSLGRRIFYFLKDELSLLRKCVSRFDTTGTQFRHGNSKRQDLNLACNNIAYIVFISVSNG